MQELFKYARKTAKSMHKEDLVVPIIDDYFELWSKEKGLMSVIEGCVGDACVWVCVCILNVMCL